MKRAYILYIAWFTTVLVIAAGAAAWYRHVEKITWQALASRLNETPVPTDKPAE